MVADGASSNCRSTRDIARAISAEAADLRVLASHPEPVNLQVSPPTSALCVEVAPARVAVHAVQPSCDGSSVTPVMSASCAIPSTDSLNTSTGSLMSRSARGKPAGNWSGTAPSSHDANTSKWDRSGDAGVGTLHPPWTLVASSPSSTIRRVTIGLPVASASVSRRRRPPLVRNEYRRRNSCAPSSTGRISTRWTAGAFRSASRCIRARTLSNIPILTVDEVRRFHCLGDFQDRRM